MAAAATLCIVTLTGSAPGGDSPSPPPSPSGDTGTLVSRPSVAGAVSSERDRGLFAVTSTATEPGDLVRSRSESCAAARRALRFYRGAYERWRYQMGAGPARPTLGSGGTGRQTSPSPCPHYLAHVWQRKARAARMSFKRWFARAPKLAGETWRDLRLDSPVNTNLLRIARCETGYLPGGRPNWRHRNSTYVGALGFAWTTWRYYRQRVRPLPPADGSQATRAEQLAVGRALVREFGGYSPWPACHRRLGLSD
ncbi:MAG: hypothetical protein KatS3mg015_2530 [Fimbriimonadales bacterium]|nr:MAG: hypothetical protein KatS3mg015_2530 [Fimbriimonadales bacterium]